MISGDNDRWSAVCHFTENATYEFTIEAWGDEFNSWAVEFQKKFAAGITDLATEIEEGAISLEHAAARATRKSDQDRLASLAKELHASKPAIGAEIAKNPELLGLMSAYPDRSLSTESKPYLQVVVDRPEALFAAWYEFFPRSAEGKATGSRLRDCLPRVDDARAMGFNVIYFPPIHPIGFTKRKGKNNSVNSEPGDPGVPYAIGSKYGGHMAVEPELGTLEDFDWLVGEIRNRGMEGALGLSINFFAHHPFRLEQPE